MKILFLAATFYILTLLQTSFLVHFDVLGISANFVFILVVLINFLETLLGERRTLSIGLLAAVFGGFFLDIFSSKPIGFYLLILLGAALFIKLIFKSYVRIPNFGRAKK
jgi:membrane associated rhomboid family serine protease